MKKVVFEEPDYLGGITKKELTIKEAIVEQKKTAESQNYYYIDDKDALNDFLTTNWAWIEENTPWEE
jgi:hypothetical protein